MKTTNLKTWEMLKAVDENPNILVRPLNSQHRFDKPCYFIIELDRKWDIQLPEEKKVTITRNQLAVAWDKFVPQKISLTTSDNSPTFIEICAELGLESE